MERNFFDKLKDTGELYEINPYKEDTIFGLHYRSFRVKDTFIVLEVWPGALDLIKGNHYWYKEHIRVRMFDRFNNNYGGDRYPEKIKAEALIEELRKANKHELAKLILFNLDIYA